MVENDFWLVCIMLAGSFFCGIFAAFALIWAQKEVEKDFYKQDDK